MSNEQIAAWKAIVMAIAGTIREVGEAPTGVLYAGCIGKLSLDQFNDIIGLLKKAGMVAESDGHLLRWIGPKA